MDTGATGVKARNCAPTPLRRCAPPRHAVDDARSHATGGQLDRDELIRLLDQCTALFESLGEYAGQHGGQSADTGGQDNLVSAFRHWKPGDSESRATGDVSAFMAFGAQAGR